jgi:hypothetical protein
MEMAMRYALVLAVMLAANATLPRFAVAEDCTGQNCPQPQGGGHDCESKRKEQTTS